MFQLPPFLTLSNFTLFTLVMGRMAGLFAALPLFGGERVPMLIRIVTIFAMTLVCFPVLRLRPQEIPADTVSIIIMVLSETLIGITLGIAAKAVFGAVEFCGQIIGMQMGFSISSLFDPSSGQVPLMAAFQSILAMMLFLTLGVHHVFIRAMVDSFTVIPLGGWHVSGDLVSFLVTTTTGIFILGVKLAAPVMAALLATTVVLGVMARSFPQMNIFVISMPLNIGIGFVILGLSLIVFLHTLELSFGTLLQQIRAAMKLLA
jgi:flagellar biosynthetic protein FliR